MEADRCMHGWPDGRKLGWCEADNAFPELAARKEATRCGRLLITVVARQVLGPDARRLTLDSRP